MAKELISAADMKAYSQQQSDAQLSEIFDDLYDELVNDIWGNRTDEWQNRNIP